MPVAEIAATLTAHEVPYIIIGGYGARTTRTGLPTYMTSMPVATWPHRSEPVAGKLDGPPVRRQVTGVTPGRGFAAWPLCP